MLQIFILLYFAIYIINNQYIIKYKKSIKKYKSIKV